MLGIGEQEGEEKGSSNKGCYQSTEKGTDWPFQEL